MTVSSIQRLEGLAVLVLAIGIYAREGFSWALFALLLLVPDASMIGYAKGSRIGALAYNLGHTFTVPVTLGIVALWRDNGTLLLVALVWAAHIGLDRACGFGLKLDSGFHDTHLGPLKKPSSSSSPRD